MNAGRLGIYKANLDIVRDHPVFGLGFGRYQRAARPYYDRHPDADRRSHAHNNFLQIAAEAGLVGLAAFTLLFATMLRFGIEAVRRCRDPNLHAVALEQHLGARDFPAKQRFRTAA
jgi:O-antigen ligase